MNNNFGCELPDYPKQKVETGLVIEPVSEPSLRSVCFLFHFKISFY